MALFDWKDEYSIGILAIDDQHKRLVSLMNRVLESLRDVREDSCMLDALNELENSVVYHFSQEEVLFQEYGYKKSKEHGRDHVYLMKQIELVKRSLMRNDTAAAAQTAASLPPWLENHILREDAEYVRFIGKNGAAKKQPGP